MTKQNENELIDDSIPPKLEWGEIPGLTFSFLWFYRGIFFALLVIFGFFQILKISNDKISRTKQQDRESSSQMTFDDQRGYRFRDEPTDIEKLDRFVDRSLEMELDQNDAGADNNSGSNVVGVTSPIPLRSDPELIRFRKFLSTATPDRLILKSTQLSRQFSNVSLPEASSNVMRRRQISDRLRQLEIDEDQRMFADVAELESLSAMDALNVQNGFGLPDTRKELIKFATNLSDHKNPKVVAKANLALAMSIGCDLLVARNSASMDAFLNEYRLRIDSIMLDPPCVFSVARFLIQIQGYEVLRDSVEWVVDDFLAKCQQNQSPDVQLVGLKLTKELVFGDLEVETMLKRMERPNGFIHADIDEFFRRLELNPQMTADVFAVALAIVAKHQQTGQHEDAARLVERLSLLQPKIVNADAKVLVATALQRLASDVSDTAGMRSH